MKKGVNILVVDDEPLVRDALSQLLGHCGCQVETADGGEAALAVLARRDFDVVITDFSMPGLHGDQLVARIRERWPAQRVIMATGFVDEYKVFGQPASHVDALLLKPFTFQELQDAIERVLTLEAPEVSGALPPPEDDFRPPAEP